MPLAFVLISAKAGFEDEIAKEIKKIENIIETHSVYGVYDVIAKVEADTMEKLKDTVHWKIRGLDNVKSTLTMIVMKGKR